MLAIIEAIILYGKMADAELERYRSLHSLNIFSGALLCIAVM